MGGMGTYRSSYGGGLDKSMEGLKLGFQSKFGAQLGLPQNKGGMGNLSTLSGANPQTSTQSEAGAAVQPAAAGHFAGASVTGSQALSSTPSSLHKGGNPMNDD